MIFYLVFDIFPTFSQILLTKAATRCRLQKERSCLCGMERETFNIHKIHKEMATIV